MKQLLSHVVLQLRIGFRDWAYMFSSIFLPAGLYWFFAVPESGNAFAAQFMTASFCAFAFYGVVFLQYAINTAQEKESAWSLYLNTLPIREHLFIFSRLITSVILGALACGLIYSVSQLTTPSELSFPVFLQMVAYLTLGGLPFLLMGLAVGQLFNPRAVVPVASFLHLVLSFAGGLWKPPEILPEALQSITPWLPTYHYGILAWSLGSPEISIQFKNIAYLVIFGILMACIYFYQRRNIELKVS